MINEVLKRMMGGIAWGGIFTFIALTALVINDINPHVSTIWLYMAGSLVLGIYFGIASFIFEREGWSPLKKTMVHFLLSVVVYFTIALPVGWVIFSPIAIILTFFVFVAIYILFWFGFQLYYKRVEAALNKTLHKK